MQSPCCFTLASLRNRGLRQLENKWPGTRLIRIGGKNRKNRRGLSFSPTAEPGPRLENGLFPLFCLSLRMLIHVIVRLG